MVLSPDMLIEGVHFERSSISARDLGAKSIVVNVSDIAAMAASPRYAMVSLGIPVDVDAAWVMELFGGMRAACDEYALALVGGDTNRADTVVIAVAVVGEVGSGHAVTRSGARPGDIVVVTGSLGAAAGGFLLSRIHPSKLPQALAEPWGRELLDAQARPVARGGEGQTLAPARARGDLRERFGVTLSDVGVIIDEGLVAVDAEGRESPLEPKGWDHFATG